MIHPSPASEPLHLLEDDGMAGEIVEIQRIRGKDGEIK